MTAKTPLLILVAALAVACGGAASMSPAPSGIAAESVSPTATSQASSSPAASVEPSPNRTGTITAPPVRTPLAHPTQAAAPPAAGMVSIVNFAYEPVRLTVAPGARIVWRNEDQSRHTVTSGPSDAPDGRFDSGVMEMGQTFELTLAEPGSYEYFCNLHPRMTALVEVQP